jgi:hypothetical protein
MLYSINPEEIKNFIACVENPLCSANNSLVQCKSTSELLTMWGRYAHPSIPPPITVIQRDLQIPTVKEEIRRYGSQYSARLSTHPNDLIVNLIELPGQR